MAKRKATRSVRSKRNRPRRNISKRNISKRNKMVGGDVDVWKGIPSVVAKTLMNEYDVYNRKLPMSGLLKTVIPANELMKQNILNNYKKYHNTEVSIQLKGNVATPVHPLSRKVDKELVVVRLLEFYKVSANIHQDSDKYYIGPMFEKNKEWKQITTSQFTKLKTDYTTDLNNYFFNLETGVINPSMILSEKHEVDMYSNKMNKPYDINVKVKVVAFVPAKNGNKDEVVVEIPNIEGDPHYIKGPFERIDKSMLSHIYDSTIGKLGKLFK